MGAIRSLPKQIYALVGAAVLLAVLLDRVNRQTPDIEKTLLEAELIVGIPPIPNLSGWPKSFLSELKIVHQAIIGTDGGVAALGKLGELYFANGFYGEARQCFGVLVGLDPQNPRWAYFLGLVTRDYQDKRVAIDAFERALALDSSYLNIRYELGMTYVESGHLLDSVEQLKPLLERSDWEPWARYGLARGLALEERYEEASEQLKRAIERDPSVKKFFALFEEVALDAGNRVEADQARAKKELLPYEKTLYDSWVQDLWERCYDTIRLARFAEAEALAGDKPRAAEMIARAGQLQTIEGSSSVELEAVSELLDSLN